MTLLFVNVGDVCVRMWMWDVDKIVSINQSIGVVTWNKRKGDRQDKTRQHGRPQANKGMNRYYAAIVTQHNATRARAADQPNTHSQAMITRACSPSDNTKQQTETASRERTGPKLSPEIVSSRLVSSRLFSYRLVSYRVATQRNANATVEEQP